MGVKSNFVIRVWLGREERRLDGEEDDEGVDFEKEWVKRRVKKMDNSEIDSLVESIPKILVANGPVLVFLGFIAPRVDFSAHRGREGVEVSLFLSSGPTLYPSLSLFWCESEISRSRSRSGKEGMVEDGGRKKTA